MLWEVLFLEYITSKSGNSAFSCNFSIEIDIKDYGTIIRWLIIIPFAQIMKQIRLLQYICLHGQHNVLFFEAFMLACAKGFSWLTIFWRNHVKDRGNLKCSNHFPHETQAPQAQINLCPASNIK